MILAVEPTVFGVQVKPGAPLTSAGAAREWELGGVSTRLTIAAAESPFGVQGEVEERASNASLFLLLLVSAVKKS
jgi:hypothetical protein